MEQITRRKFIGTTLIAGGTAAAFALTGCGAKDQKDSTPEQTFDLNNSYLPLGSVVYIGQYKEIGIPAMIVARKPFISNPPEGHEGEVYDYAAVTYPFGIQSNLSQHEYQGELTAFNSEDITEILHVGYINDQEERAAATLQENRDSTDFGVTVLSDQYFETLQKNKDFLEQLDSGK